MTIRCEHIMQISQLEAQNTPILSCSLIQTSIDLYIEMYRFTLMDPNANAVQNGLFSQNCIASPLGLSPPLRLCQPTGGLARLTEAWRGACQLGLLFDS